MTPVQENLLELPKAESEEATAGKQVSKRQPRVGPPKLKPIDRNQFVMRPMDLERLIPDDHRARAVWALTGRMDLKLFQQDIVSVAGQAGRSCWDPRLLVSIWVYAYSEGISSAREIEREMEWEPGLMWLSAMGVVNHHTLSDFRAHQREALENLFSQLLALLEAEGLVDLRQVMVDGTKVRAQASSGSLRRKATIEKHLDLAKAVVAQMTEAEKEGRSVREAARQRAARERQERLEEALKELAELEAGKTEQQAAELRVSESEPEARRMKHADGAYAPSYNVQVSTDAQSKIVVGVHVTQEGNDLRQLEPALAVVEQTAGRKPEQVVADAGYATRSNIINTAAARIEFLSLLASEEEKAEAALKGRQVRPEFLPKMFVWDAGNNCFRCPAGKCLGFVGQEAPEPEHRFAVYQARKQDCQQCPHKPQCCPKTEKRTVKRVVSDHPAVEAFRENMRKPDKQEAYKKRASVAESVNAWLKDKLGVRRFRLRGMQKAGIEVLWAFLGYNFRQWVRLREKAVPISA